MSVGEIVNVELFSVLGVGCWVLGVELFSVLGVELFSVLGVELFSVLGVGCWVLGERWYFWMF